MKARIFLEGNSRSFTVMGLVVHRGKPTLTSDPEVIEFCQRQRGLRVELISEKGRPTNAAVAAKAAAEEEDEPVRSAPAKSAASKTSGKKRRALVKGK